MAKSQSMSAFPSSNLNNLFNTNNNTTSTAIEMAIAKDKEMFRKQQEVLIRTKEKEAKMVEKIMINEEAKNRKAEEHQKKFQES